MNKRTSMMLAGLLALAGCGGGSSSNGVASKSPQQILAAAEAAVHTAKSVHVSGTIVNSGHPITIDLHLAAGKGGEGQMSVAGVSFRMISTGDTVYINGSQAFWQRFGGTGAAQLLQGKWLKGPASGSFASFAQLMSIPDLFGKIATSHGVLKKGSTTTINGQSAIALEDTTQGGTLDVATTGQPYPLVIYKTGSGRVTFDQYNQAVTLNPPKNAVDISKLQG